MTQNTRHLRRNPTQSRAEATLRAIREACLKILEEEGHKRLTTNRIAEVAGISIGSLYQYYADKRAIAADICNELLLAELNEVDRLDEQAISMVRNSLETTMKFFVEEYVARHRRLYLKLKGFYLEMHWHYDFETYVLKTRPGKLTTVEWLPRALKRYRDILGVHDLVLASTMIVNVIEGTIHATLDRSPDLILKQEFADELLAIVLSYLKYASKSNASPGSS
ncbi:transcriptional regulator, TetR family [Geopseudomonas sagittaria]|uniref:Transcriptional regulator, TetR family n=1 Tax=Geopseudomonas sagittaria TaxID=1135990 RepID=A0A1I5R0L2_9GAMM|nr:TetR/AcrR family transcriptional regulator [Pseudomonas sagittaria]SFP51596.1 transcriptional regulator, TetR family [Pseudomonas sagittaria]